MKILYESEEKLKDAPKFCKKCGARVLHKKERTCFDEKTGEERFSTNVECPNGKKWYTFGHTSERYTENDFLVKEMFPPFYF